MAARKKKREPRTVLARLDVRVAFDPSATLADVERALTALRKQPGVRVVAARSVFVVTG